MSDEPWEYRVKHQSSPWGLPSPYFVYGGGDDAHEYYEMYVGGQYVGEVHTNGEQVWMEFPEWPNARPEDDGLRIVFASPEDG